MYWRVGARYGSVTVAAVIYLAGCCHTLYSKRLGKKRVILLQPLRTNSPKSLAFCREEKGRYRKGIVHLFTTPRFCASAVKFEYDQSRTRSLYAFPVSRSQTSPTDLRRCPRLQKEGENLERELPDWVEIVATLVPGESLLRPAIHTFYGPALILHLHAQAAPFRSISNTT